jgi:hypothetical protein
MLILGRISHLHPDEAAILVIMDIEIKRCFV